MKDRSCTTTLIYVVKSFRSKIDTYGVAFLVLLDHTKVLDTVDHKVLFKKLRKLFYFSNSACSLIYSYLINRFQKVSFNGNISYPLNISRGVRQKCSRRGLVSSVSAY